MILSMTGFAAVADELPQFALTVELRAVNHRYLDVTLKLPDELRVLEPALRERIAAELKRGKVECRVALARRDTASPALSFDAARVAELQKADQAVRMLVPSATPLSVAEILRWPGVVVEASLPVDILATRVHALIDAALSELAASRAREGDKLARLLLARCGDIESQIARVAPRIPALHAAFVEKLGARLREAGFDLNDERMKQELHLFATKIDVAEEVARLSTHVAEVRRVLDVGGSAGKRLDFLAQELHREANTLGSKSVDAELSKVALELKVLIEQMREQVQNIE
ncbi:MAG TPA: YicC/YloC family endoribonuclease [Casimicrobiaceae bacterium]|nr:YicC/YloC family endoribonuclease [Casimicrobiaceae bacterium]